MEVLEREGIQSQFLPIQKRGRLRLCYGWEATGKKDGGCVFAQEDGGWLWVIPMGIERVAARWDKKPRF